ncbi:MAG: type IV secretion system protein [bacterium]
MDPCDWPVFSSACDAAGEAVGTVVEDGSVRVLGAIAEGIASFAAMVLEGLWELIQQVTNPQTDADFLYQWAGMLFGVALPITVAFMCFQVIQSLLQARGFSRSGVFSAVTGAALAIFGTAASLPVVHYLTVAVDGVADAMTGVIVGDIGTLGDAFANAVGGDGVSMYELFTPFGQEQVVLEGTVGVLGGLIGTIVLGFLMIMGGIAVFAALLIRTLLLYAVVVTGPIAFLGLVWSPVRPWFRRWVVAVIALVFTKLGVVVVFGLGITAMNNLDFDGGVLEALGRLLAGTVLMLISAFVPIVAFKFFGFLGEQAVESLHAGASASVHRSREVVGQLSPQRVMDRVSGQSTTRQIAQGQGPSSNGAGPQTAQPGAAQQRRYHEGRPQHATSARPAAGARSGGGASSAGAGSRAGTSGGGGAAGTAAAGAGAVVGAGAAAADKVRSAGQHAGGKAAADDPYTYDPSRTANPPPPRGRPPRA